MSKENSEKNGRGGDLAQLRQHRAGQINPCGSVPGRVLGAEIAPLVVGEVNGDLPRKDYLKRLQVPFCDKPIGGSVQGTRKILEFARKNQAPLMSSGLFRHEFGTEHALRLRDTADGGKDVSDRERLLFTRIRKSWPGPAVNLR